MKLQNKSIDIQVPYGQFLVKLVKVRLFLDELWAPLVYFTNAFTISTMSIKKIRISLKKKRNYGFFLITSKFLNPFYLAGVKYGQILEKIISRKNYVVGFSQNQTYFFKHITFLVVSNKNNGKKSLKLRNKQYFGCPSALLPI